MSDLRTSSQPLLVDLGLLAEVSQLLTGMDLDHVLERVVELIARSIDATRASLLLRDPLTNEWHLLDISGHYDPLNSAQVIGNVVNAGLASWVIRERRGTIVDDTEQDPRWQVFDDANRSMRSVLCLPLIQDDEVLAVITLLHAQPYHFNQDHLRVLSIVTNQAAVAIRNTQLFRRMQAQQSQLEAILHAIPEMLLVVDDAGTILLANDAAAEFIGGVARQELVGRSLDSVIQHDSAFAPLAKLTNSPELVEGTWVFETHSDRRRQDCVINVSRWHDQTPGVTGYVILKHDVTTLRDLDRFKSEILRMASHDLRSPLALIVGYCDLIEFDTPPDSPQAEYLSIIRRSTRRMSTLLDDLLRVEEIRSSPAELQRPTDFAELVHGVADNLMMQAESRRQSVTVDVRLDGLEPITLDPMLIREAMENLAGNASKYTDEGGQIRIESYYDEHRVHFIVIDNGCGISEADLPRLFDWGFRAKRHAETGATDGKGMGLSLVKTVLERHDGEVWVESKLGEGSRFGFWLPR